MIPRAGFKDVEALGQRKGGDPSPFLNQNQIEIFTLFK